MTATPAQITVQDVIAQCRAYRDAAHERGDSGIAREWQLVWLSLNELTAEMTPTPAQIEAADMASRLEKLAAMLRDATPDDLSEIREAIKIELTAAAEVGTDSDGYPDTWMKDGLVAATIERCAQVAEDLRGKGDYVAAAIRALKDKS